MGEKREQPDPVGTRGPTIVMALIAFLGPWGISISTMSDSIVIIASTWMLNLTGGWSNYTSGPELWAVMAPLTLLRLIFVLQIFRYYRGNSTRRRTAIVGALVESPIWGSSIFVILLNMWGPILSLPLPFLFIVGVLIVWVYPYHVEEGKHEVLW